MHSNKSLRSRLACLTTVFMTCLTLPSFLLVHQSLGTPEYTYYGVVPSKIYHEILNNLNDRNSGWRLDNGTIVTASPLLNGVTVATRSLLAVVAAENGTDFEVYNLTLNNWLLMYRGTLNSMGKQLMLLANGTTFKVVSNKQVSVSLLNYQRMPTATDTEGPVPHTFYTDINGLYVGKEFILMASTQAYYYSGQVYTILALEKATVTVTRDDGHQDTYSLNANSYQYILLNSFRVYKFVSTGNIMIQSGTVPSIANSNEGMGDVNCFPIPAAEGGFVGTFFLTISVRKTTSGWDTTRDYGFRISALENAHVKVFDLETQQLINDITVTGGSGIAIKPSANAIAVQSDKQITLSLIHNGSIEQKPPLAGNKGGDFSGYGNGVMFVGIRPNQNTPIYLPTVAHVEAYFFASNQTQLTIDGTTHTIQADSSYFYNLPGTHTVKSDNNVILQINFWPNEPESQGLWYTGAIIPCIETVNSNPSVKLTPLGGGFPMMYVVIGVGAGAAAVAVIVGLLMMRRRKPS